MIRSLAVRFLVLLVLEAVFGMEPVLVARAEAQPAALPMRGERTKSMGLPRHWLAHGGGMLGWERRDDQDDDVSGVFFLGAYRDLANPNYGALAVVPEIYLRADDEGDGGARLMAASRFFGIQGGVDYAVRNSEFDFIMSFTLALRRGGPIGGGSFFRADWFPGRNHSWDFGFHLPIFQPNAGKTRPRDDSVALPRASRPRSPVYTPGPELLDTLEQVRHAADWVARFTTPYFDQDGKNDEKHREAFLKELRAYKAHANLRDEAYPEGHTFPAEIARYHSALARAFALASGGVSSPDDLSRGARMAEGAQRILLDVVILPYNRLLGQRKKHDTLYAYHEEARVIATRLIEASDHISPQHRPAVMYVFEALYAYMEEIRSATRKRWGDSRLVWLPLHWALRPDQVDEQGELDAIIAKAVEEPFTDANSIDYVINEQFHIELSRMIHETEDYHVLWIHDYRGLNAAGDPDEVGYLITTQAYLRALINAVERYETTWKIPTYIIIIDQFFFEATKGRLWLELLDDPLNHTIDLPNEFAAWETEILRLQDELRRAVAASPTLQEGARRYGRVWLENRVKIHVSITNPADLSFRSPNMVGGLPFVPDLLMRDHRKITFFDVTERDPSKGEAMYTGMGIGEHYTGPTWDDRAVLARGPFLVSLKDAARELLRSQGFRESDIPLPLRPLPYSDDYEQQLDALRERGWSGSALQVHNGVGYAPKMANLVKAVLYDLMPAGSHMYLPDPIWNSALWGGMVVGAALRGCWVFPVSPARDNAPSASNPVMSRSSELFGRFVLMQDEIHDEIEAAGGLFRTGIYNMQVETGDMITKGKMFRENVQDDPFIHRVFPFDPSVYRVIGEITDELEARGYEPRYLVSDVEDRLPKLHLKSQFFASKDALDTMVPLPGWRDLVRDYVLARAEQYSRSGDEDVGVKSLREALSGAAVELGRQWRSALTPEVARKSMFYMATGSHNQNYRSTIMDAEVTVLVSRVGALASYLDFVGLMLQTTWVDDFEQLDELLPHYSGKWRWIGRHVRNAF